MKPTDVDRGRRGSAIFREAVARLRKASNGAPRWAELKGLGSRTVLFATTFVLRGWRSSLIDARAMFLRAATRTKNGKSTPRGISSSLCASKVEFGNTSSRSSARRMKKVGDAPVRP